MPENVSDGRKDVTVAANTAAMALAVNRPLSDSHPPRAVQTMLDAIEALDDEGNEHHCPLCNEYFTTAAFIRHGRACVKLRAPRHKVWVPAGYDNALAAFPDKRGGA